MPGPGSVTHPERAAPHPARWCGGRSRVGCAMPWIRSVVTAVLVVVAVGATGPGAAAATPTTSATVPATVWLCRPGLADNPCTPSLATTRTTPSGGIIGVSTPVIPAHPPIDCFYVYPTVSDQKTPNANLTVDPTERSIALYQAARFSSV